MLIILQPCIIFASFLYHFCIIPPPRSLFRSPDRLHFERISYFMHSMTALERIQSYGFSPLIFYWHLFCRLPGCLVIWFSHALCLQSNKTINTMNVLLSWYLWPWGAVIAALFYFSLRLTGSIKSICPEMPSSFQPLCASYTQFRCSSRQPPIFSSPSSLYSGS